jgi:mono/diheme cytochrome c family protein
MSRPYTVCLAARALAALLLSAAACDAAAPVEFDRDIRPLLAEHCFACHGSDASARKAKLRLDQRDAAVKQGAIVPGKPDESGLVERIFSDDPKHLMPPPKSNKKLTPEQKDRLRRWVAAGAPYQAHWSLIPPVRPKPPEVKDKSWVRNPVDAFVLDRLERAGLRPAPEADRRTLARRLSLDLTGLPPAPAEVKAFVDDKAPDAYERYVDRLLASPRWGEHRGRYWLDAARYADTNGIHFDNYREIWSYRDWVIGAFNKNMPFDRFTTEQLAGDLLPNATLDQRIASGFNRCNITTNEGGAISEEYLVLYTRDRTETTSQVWLGMTAGCAVCHDHKFDPLSQKEFYSMAAFFNNTTQAAMDGNIKDTPPVVVVPKEDDRPRWEALAKELPEAKRKQDERRQLARAEFDKWLAGQAEKSAAQGVPTEGLQFFAPLSEETGEARLTVNGKERTAPLPGHTDRRSGYVAAKAFKIQPGVNIEVADAGDYDKGQPFSFGAWVFVPRRETTGAIFARMDDQHDYRGWDLWLQGNRVGTHIINRWPQDALKVVSRDPVPTARWTHVFVTCDGSAKPSGVHVYVNGVAQPTNVEADSLKQTTRTTVPLKLGQRHTSSRVDGVEIQDMRIYGRALPAAEVVGLFKGVRMAYLAAKPAAKRTKAENNELFDDWLPARDEPFRKASERVAQLENEQKAIRSRGTAAHVMQEKGEPAMAYVLYRGDYDKRRDPVKPDTPRALSPMPPELPRNRLGFAQWLLRPEHPLTARVTVNRFWQELFGTGIVRTAGDFGVTGEPPSHPELLDWLAVEFRESGWDVKKFFKLLVTSATYRQSAQTTPEKLEKDPHNRLLSRGPRFRMDAEMVRDYALAASGRLSPKIGGPSVRPYQPEGVWEAVAMIGSDTRDYRPDQGDSLYRRSMYTLWKRAAPPASMDILNAPSREVCTVRRERTDTPLQALVTLNDPQFVEAARSLAEATLKQGGKTPETQLDFVAERLLARPFRPVEVKVVRATLDDLLKHYREHSAEADKLVAVGESKADPALDRPTLAAWTMLANQLLNLDEVLNK